jgi:ectoine hydroxylase-related dioxygenase (phytanoyl-CoA dioxygenase family)
MTTTGQNAELQQTFTERGFVILKGLLEPEVVEQARAAMKTLVDQRAARLLAEGKIRDTLPDAPFETRMAKLYAHCLDDAPKSFRPELHLPGLFGVFFHPDLLDIVEMFLGPEIRLYPNYTARPKLPDWEGTLVLWHQDGGYTAGGAETDSVTQLHMVNVWSPLVPAREANGCMQFVPGTHRLGVVPHEQKKHYLEIAPDYLKRYEDQAVSIELDPGDVVLFHNLLFHRGLPNRTDKIRWSLDWRYQDATQPTLREHVGHIARSRSQPEQAVQSAEQWASLTFR